MSPAPGVPAAMWTRLGSLVATTLGLHFPGKRQDDLQRGFLRAAADLGFDSPEACIHWLLRQTPTATTIGALARHLTVAETYFFRDRPTLDALSTEVLPALIQARRGRVQQLRLWCAACCTGEEAYTLAILLHRLLPDLADWQVQIRATDINGDALQKAADGTYSEWSFRAAPEWLRAGYFTPGTHGRHRILPAIRRMVNFETENLVQAVDGAGRVPPGAMDVILCRNVLMYFAAPQMNKVVALLKNCLQPGGWLAVGPGEVSAASLAGFTPVSFPGAMLFRRDDDAQLAPSRAAGTGMPPSGALAADPQAAQKSGGAATALALPAKPDIEQVTGAAAPGGTLPVVELARRARASADGGDLEDALAWCERWLHADKLDPAGHYVKATVLLEQGELDAAQSALERAIYLDGGFVLAHVALGNLARMRGQARHAGRHFANVQRLLRQRPAGDVLPGSGGLTVARLAETIRALAANQCGL